MKRAPTKNSKKVSQSQRILNMENRLSIARGTLIFLFGLQVGQLISVLIR